MIVVVDYGAANLLSITRALEAGGAAVEVSGDPERMLQAEALVLPGVGAAGSAMRQLRATGGDRALREAVALGRPLLGVCLGMQLFFERIEEDDARGLALLPGDVALLRDVPKIPHMGWNTLTRSATPAAPVAETFLADTPGGWQGYFVHSYVCRPAEPAQVAAWTDYGGPFCAVIARDNLLGVQYHPEKSGVVGVGQIRAWIRWVGEQSSIHAHQEATR